MQSEPERDLISSSLESSGLSRSFITFCQQICGDVACFTCIWVEVDLWFRSLSWLGIPVAADWLLMSSLRDFTGGSPPVSGWLPGNDALKLFRVLAASVGSNSFFSKKFWRSNWYLLNGRPDVKAVSASQRDQWEKLCRAGCPFLAGWFQSTH